MTPAPDHSPSDAVFERYLAVLGDLTALAEREGAVLERGQRLLPPHLLRRKEDLVQEYAVLTAAVRERARDLWASGLLDPAELDARIRRLVALMKENQRRLNAFKARTAERVDAVMRALAVQEPCTNTEFPAAGTTGGDPKPCASLRP